MGNELPLAAAIRPKPPVKFLLSISAVPTATVFNSNIWRPPWKWAGCFQLSLRDQFWDELHLVRTPGAVLREHFT